MMTTDQDDVTQDEIRDYTLLTQTIFPDELTQRAEDTPGQDRDVEEESSTRWPSATRFAALPTIDFESEIVALAHRINREKKLILPTATPNDPVRDGTLPRCSSRYPQIPLDKSTEHSVIWRTTEATAENSQIIGSKNRNAHTPTTYDDDLEPALPPGLARDVTEWMNKLMMNLAARIPAIKRSPDGPDTEPGVKPDLPTLGWEDVLKAISSDTQSPDEKELNERITQRVKARFAKDPAATGQNISQDTGSTDDAIVRLQERQAVLDQALERRRDLEQSLWDEDEGFDSRESSQRKRRKVKTPKAEHVDVPT